MQKESHKIVSSLSAYDVGTQANIIHTLLLHPDTQPALNQIFKVVKTISPTQSNVTESLAEEECNTNLFTPQIGSTPQIGTTPGSAQIGTTPQ